MTPAGDAGSPAAAGGSAGLEDLCARIPRLECRRLCGHSCGPIVVPAAEWRQLTRAGGPREAGADLVCPYLERGAGLCEVYASRPLICRLWGVAETLPCPHGCQPERWLSAAEVEALLEEAIARSGGRGALGLARLGAAAGRRPPGGRARGGWWREASAPLE